MAHIEIHIIKGRKYKYEVTNYRIGKNIKHKWKYLGPIEPLNKRRNPNAGRKPAIFVRAITEEESHSLQIAWRSNEAFTRDRAKIILLSSNALPVKKIAEKIFCEERKVRVAIDEFNKKGIAALQRGKAKGAIPKFDEVKKKMILMHFSQKPSKFNYHFTTWTLPRFRKHIIDYNVVNSISVETVRQMLNEAGARLKRSKRWQYSPDPEFHKKNLQ
jgi:hypothetical protein